ncbi:MAG TPA: STAS domain-containing protein [Terriglobales bacterium]|nr:STAS domain-containing protein [Terriglobales bacterium]
MSTTVTPFSFVVDGERVTEGLLAVAKNLEGAGPEALLDFFFVQDIDQGGLRALEDLASAAEEKRIKVILRGVNVEIYKVMKLSRLTERYTFVN